MPSALKITLKKIVKKNYISIIVSNIATINVCAQSTSSIRITSKCSFCDRLCEFTAILLFIINSVGFSGDKIFSQTELW